MRQFILIYFLFSSLVVFSQNTDTLNHPKFEFVKYNSGKPKSIKQGTYLNVTLSDNDTIHVQAGDLIDLNDSQITIDLGFEQYEIENKHISYYSTFNYDSLRRISIPITSIKYASYEHTGAKVFAGIGGVSMITALFIAPVAAIDKNAPYYFNSKRYTRIVVPALIGTTVGLHLYYAFGTERRIIPKLIIKI